ncbi:amiloride-sensitive sodium channel subunit beta-like [Ptychodera flava]|uniref:amiloride-sensitive sodium channel subunit beta-like n=1 Tax=Ptychodera flava TaxID=63121 RepID=UPI003969CCF7
MNPLRDSALEIIDDEYKERLAFLKYEEQSEDDADADEESIFTTTSESEDLAEYSSVEHYEFDFRQEDLIQECVFNGITCSSNTETNPKYGNCYTFNTGANTSKPGPSTGLRLTLFIEQDEYLENITENAGAVVLVHPPDIVPFPEEQGLELPPGFSASLGLRLSVIERIGGKYSDCIKAGEMPLLYKGYNYSVEACVKTCYQNKLVNECKCYDTTLPNNEPIPTCVDGTKKAMEDTVSMSHWPSDAFGDKLYERLGKRSKEINETLQDLNELRRNLIKLKVFFSELNFENIKEKPAFDSVDLLSSLGGLIGLYIGASVISLFEFFEFVAKVCCLIKTKWRVSDEADERVQMG